MCGDSLSDTKGVNSASPHTVISVYLTAVKASFQGIPPCIAGRVHCQGGLDFPMYPCTVHPMIPAWIWKYWCNVQIHQCVHHMIPWMYVEYSIQNAKHGEARQLLGQWSLMFGWIYIIPYPLYLCMHVGWNLCDDHESTPVHTICRPCLAVQAMCYSM